MRFSAKFAAALLCLAAPVALRAESIFDFEAVAQGSLLPLTVAANGLTATFTGGGAVCSSAGLSGEAMFVGLSGNALVQGLCTPASSTPIVMSFSQGLSKVSFALAINGDTPAPVLVTFRQHGTVVATQTVNPAVPLTGSSPEAAVTYSGSFDSVTLTSGSLLAIDNVDAIPQ